MSNLGTIDRVLRALVGAALVLLPWFSGWPLWSNQIAFIAAELVGVILVATAAFSFCPIYAALGLSSRRKTST